MKIPSSQDLSTLVHWAGASRSYPTRNCPPHIASKVFNGQSGVLHPKILSDHAIILPSQLLSTSDHQVHPNMLPNFGKT